MKLDHIAVSGETLDEAVAEVEQALGVAMTGGGRHAVFATHNRLLGLADGLYIEAIAADPDGTPPLRPRWFDLDSFRGPARLTNWVCACDDLDATLAALPTHVGAPVSLTRDALSWRMAVPGGGCLPFDNLHPALMQWDCEQHPSAMLPDSGCALRRLCVSHPDAGALRDMLRPHLSDDRIAFEEGRPGLFAEIATPSGTRVLG